MQFFVIVLFLRFFSETMHIQRQSASGSTFSSAEIEIGSPGRAGAEHPEPRAAWLQTFYDRDGKLKPDVLRGLTPGTAEFAVLDATVRRERRQAPHLAVFKQINRRYMIKTGPACPPDHSLPAFDQGVLHSLRALLQSSPRSQAFILADDGHAEDLLRGYQHLCDLASRNPAAAEQDPEAALVSTYDFEAELDRSFARLYARRGSTDPWDDGVRRNAIRKPRSAARGRALSLDQVEVFKRTWSTLGGVIELSETNESLQVRLGNNNAWLSIASDHISFSGLGYLGEIQRLETARLATLHAREHWGASMAIRDATPAGATRLMAFAEFFRVNVVSCDIHVPREAVDGMKRQLLQTYGRDGVSRERSRPFGMLARIRRRLRRMVGASLTR